MATPAPISFENWNNSYLDLLQTVDTASPEYQFFIDSIETITELLVVINVLEARIAALEP